MAEKSRREVELALSITTANADSLKELRDSVRALAKEGGDAAPEFERLANELDQLARQAKDLTALDALARDLNDASVAQKALSATSEPLRQQLKALGEVTEQARAKQENLKAEYNAASRAQSAASNAIKQLKNEYDVADRGLFAYTSKLKELTKQELDARAVKLSLGEALDKARLATKEAASEQAKLGQQFRAANTETERASTTVRTLQADYDKLAAQLKESGVDSSNLATAQKQVQDAMLRTREAIRGVINEQEQAEATAKALAAAEARRAEEAKANAVKYISWWTQALEAREQGERRTAAAADAAATTSAEAARRIDDAFRRTGAGATRDLQSELDLVRQAMIRLANSGVVTGDELARAMKQGEARVKELERALRAARGEMTLMDRAGGLLSTTIGKLGAFFGLYEIVMRTATAFVTATKSIESMRLGLGQIYGSAELATKQINFLRKAANDGGVAVGDISAAFIKFAASAKESNIPIETTNELFAALTRAAGTLGLSSEKTNQALEALSQMAGKGVVNMEELRQQLGDALPGALALVSKGLGITQTELFKLVEAGGLTARDLIPALTESLKLMGGEINTLNASWARLKNAVGEGMQQIGDTGPASALKNTLDALTVVTQRASAAISVMSESFGGLYSAARAAREGFGQDGVAGALKSVGEQALKSGERLALHAKALFGTEWSAAAARARLEELRLENEKGKKVTDASTESVERTGNAWVMFGVAADKAKKALEQNIAVAERASKAVEVQANNIRTLAQLSGDQTRIINAEAEAAQRSRVAYEAVARAREEEVSALRLQLTQRILLMAADAEEDTAKTEIIKKLQEQIDLREQDAAKARQQADASRNLVQQAEIEKQTHLDNSLRLDELRENYEKAREVLEYLTEAKKQGNAVDVQVEAAARNAATAQRLYADAVKDTEEKQSALTGLKKADLSVTEAQIGLRRAQISTAIAVAKAIGDEYTVQRLTIEQKRLDIKMIQAKVGVMRAEAKGLLEVAQAKRDALIASGNYTTAQLAEADASIRVAKARMIEADATEEGIRLINEEIQAIELGVGARQRSAGAIDSETSALERNNSARERGLSLKGKETNASNVMSADNTLQMDLAARLRDQGSKGMTEEQIREAIRQAENVYRDMEATRNINAGVASAEYIRSAQAMMNAANTARNQLNGRALRGQPVEDNTTQAPASSGSTTVNINLNGRSTSINVASQSDATALADLLRQLESASGRAI
jgi:tape measure domain-containing protein